ncbi:MAG TPA: DUF6607 family protein [Alphaproteobacteria bacterium]|jgi:hypothetical protein|nr:DUF6607 family protein [Alphaproteobacteria bacterium]
MHRTHKKTAVMALCVTLTLSACASQPGGMTGASPAHADTMAKDREAILAMAGTFDVTFDFRETVPFVADYKPIAAHVSKGHEVVKVVEDTGRVIRLQHLLVVQEKDKPPIVVKHWRQDWEYEPSQILVYTGPGHWSAQAVPAADRKGAWSQIVYQTDDSPRYGAVGRWTFDNEVAEWTSQETLRPLARRDAVRHPPYDRYVAVNRHAITPTGWVQEEDNAKVGQKDGRSVTFTHETVVNSYDRATDFNIQAADDYWAATKDYWATVRADWDARLVSNKQIVVPEVAEDGSATGVRLGDLADDILGGTKKTEGASVAAKAIIEGTPKS